MPTIPGPELPPGAVVARPPASTVWDFSDRTLHDVTFRGVRDGEEWLAFRRTVFQGCTFERCDLQWHWGSHHERQDEAARFVGCRIVRCDLRNTSFAYGRIEGCTIDSCRWRRHLTAVDVVDTVFLGVVDGLTLWGRDLSLPGTVRPRERPNEIRGNDFRGADLRGLGLMAGVPVHDQLWPEGPACAVVDRVPERVAAILRRTEGSDDPADVALRDSAQWYLDWREPGTEQDTLWLRWDDPSMPEASNRFHRAVAHTSPD